jgi:hypothetical protein
MEMKKAGFAPAFLFALVATDGAISRHFTSAATHLLDAFSSREPVPTSLENAMPATIS